ncbi:major capsid protein [Polaromonas sp.]|uniref:major capsid protein n=1 Tax=Polaromonas sp. TaxID=1869339 RepID=UPI003264F6E1
MENKTNLLQMMLALVLMALAALAVPAHAAAVDVANIVTDIGAQAVPIGLIGGAVLLIVVAVKAFKWVRSALS